MLICIQPLPSSSSICLYSPCIMAEPSTSSSSAATENSRNPVQACLEHPKRTRGSPTLLTPHWPRPLRRDAGPTPLGQLRRLGFESPRAPAPVPQQGNAWTDAETKALVEFILITCGGDSWPSHKRVDVWKDTAALVKKRTNITRSSTFVRSWQKR